MLKFLLKSFSTFTPTYSCLLLPHQIISTILLCSMLYFLSFSFFSSRSISYMRKFSCSPLHIFTPTYCCPYFLDSQELRRPMSYLLNSSRFLCSDFFHKSVYNFTSTLLRSSNLPWESEAFLNFSRFVKLYFLHAQISVLSQFIYLHQLFKLVTLPWESEIF